MLNFFGLFLCWTGTGEREKWEQETVWKVDEVAFVAHRHSLNADTMNITKKNQQKKKNKWINTKEKKEKRKKSFNSNDKQKWSKKKNKLK